MTFNSENSGDDPAPRGPMPPVAADRLQRLGILNTSTTPHTTNGHSARPHATHAANAATKGPRSAWPMLVVGLISINMVVVGITIYLATGRGAASVEPDYYHKATQWDQTAQRKAASDRLGWSMSLAVRAAPHSAAHASVGSASPEPSQCELRLELHDAQAAPIEHAAVEVEAFHNAFSRERLYLKLAESAKGVYSVPALITRPGHWHFRIRADRGTQIFVHEFDQEITLTSATSPTPPK